MEMNQPAPRNPLDDNRQGHIGRAMDRVDGPQKVTGTAPYAYEVQEAPAAPAAEVPATPADAEERLEVRNAIGLHARPAARFVGVARGYDAEVLVAKAGGGAPVRATSLTNVVALGARFGDTLVVSASGSQAAEVLAALRVLADSAPDYLPTAVPHAVALVEKS